jgi:hypothetical protein
LILRKKAESFTTYERNILADIDDLDLNVDLTEDDIEKLEFEHRKEAEEFVEGLVESTRKQAVSKLISNSLIRRKTC